MPTTPIRTRLDPLPIATPVVLGVVKLGTDVTGTADGTLILSPDILGRINGAKIATGTTVGLVKPGIGLTILADGTLNTSGILRGPWTANTSYGAYDGVINPSGVQVYALAAIPAGTSYVDANWTLNVPLASTTVAGSVKQGPGTSIAADGTLTVAGLTSTDQLPEGVTNLYFTQARAIAVATYEKLTYAQLSARVTAGTLLAGKQYALTDYQTTHTIPSTTVVNMGSVEALLLSANSTSTLSPQGYSLVYPLDIIYYTANNADPRLPGATKGFVYRRIDTSLSNDIEVDFRVVKFRRWLNATTSAYTDTISSAAAFQDAYLFDPGAYAAGQCYGNKWGGFGQQKSVLASLNMVSDATSYVFNNTFSAGSNLSGNSLLGGSYFSGNTGSSSDFGNNIIVGGSFFQSNNATASTITGNSLKEVSNLTSNLLTSSSSLNGNLLSGGSYVQSNALAGSSQINTSTLTGGSYLQNNNLTAGSNILVNTISGGSYLSSSTLINSNIILNSIGTGSYVTKDVLTNSSITRNTLTGGSYVNNDVLTNSSITGNTLTGGRYIQNNTLSNNSGIGGYVLNGQIDINSNTLINSIAIPIGAVNAFYLNDKLIVSGTVAGIFRGAWLANTTYAAYDGVINPSGVRVYAVAANSDSSYVATNWALDVPLASATVAGSVKQGANFTIAADGTLNYSLPIATSANLGGVKQGANVTIAADGTLSVQPSGTNYNLPIATSAKLGGVQQGANVTIDTNGFLSVAAPLVNTDTLPEGTTNLYYLAARQKAITDRLGTTTAADPAVARSQVPAPYSAGTGIAISSANVITNIIATTALLGGVKLGTDVTAATDGTLALSANILARINSGAGTPGVANASPTIGVQLTQDGAQSFTLATGVLGVFGVILSQLVDATAQTYDVKPISPQFYTDGSSQLAFTAGAGLKNGDWLYYVPYTQGGTGGGGGTIVTRQLPFKYLVGAADEASELALPSESGTYSVEALGNVATHYYYLNGSSTASSLPLQIAADDTVRCVITRTDTTRGAYVLLTP